MAGELQFPYVTGKTVYFLIRNSVGSIWNGAAFEAYSTGSFTNYDIAATEQGTASGYYTGTFPATSLGTYFVTAKEQAGGSPAETDQDVGYGSVQWSGTAILTANTLADAILKRDFSTITGEAQRSVINALRKLINKFDLVTNTPNLTVFKEDDVTEAYQQTVTTSTTASPVTGLDTV